MTATIPPAGPAFASDAAQPDSGAGVNDPRENHRSAPPPPAGTRMPSKASDRTEPRTTNHTDHRPLRLPVGGGIDRFLDRTASAADMTTTEVRVVLLLRTSDGLALNLEEIASAFCLDAVAAEGTASRLEAASLVVSNRALPDGRRARLHLTGDGKRLADKTLAQLRVALTARREPQGLAHAGRERSLSPAARQ